MTTKHKIKPPHSSIEPTVFVSPTLTTVVHDAYEIIGLEVRRMREEVRQGQRLDSRGAMKFQRLINALAEARRIELAALDTLDDQTEEQLLAELRAELRLASGDKRHIDA